MTESNQLKNREFWKPFPKQEVALLSKAFETLFGGARGPGKTDAGIVWMLKPVQKFGSKYRGLVIRRNSRDLSDWLDRAKILYRASGAEFVGNPCEIRFPSGSIIRSGHLNDKNSFNHYLGHEYQRILIEELTQIPEEDQYLRLISSCRSTVESLDPRVFCTTNPGGAGHKWVKRRFYDSGTPGEVFFDDKTGRTRLYIPATIDDNPILMKNDPDYVRFLDGLDGDLARAWRYGDWNISAGLFFDEFNTNDHVYEHNEIKIQSNWPRFRSVDWGYSAPTAVYWHAVGPDSHVYTYRELYVTKMLDVDLAKKVKELSGNEYIQYTVGDPMSFPVEIPHYKFGTVLPVKRSDVWSEHGVPVVMGKNSRVAGWARVREFLKVRDWNGQKSSWWHISSECKNLINELQTVIHDDKNPEDLDSSMSDHALDSCRLFLMSTSKRFDEAQKFETMLEAAERQADRIEKIYGSDF